eukprot:6512005-Prymnesium_polylepis.2
MPACDAAQFECGALDLQRDAGRIKRHHHKRVWYERIIQRGVGLDRPIIAHHSHAVLARPVERLLHEEHEDAGRHARVYDESHEEGDVLQQVRNNETHRLARSALNRPLPAADLQESAYHLQHERHHCATHHAAGKGGSNQPS